MKDRIEAYKIWAPDNALWTQWAKPVLFSSVPSYKNKIIDIPRINWMTSADYNTMIIVDLPGKEGVEEGLALAQLGYRPVPIYNGVVGQNKGSMLIDVWDIVKALFQGADELTALNIRPDAPPAFLLDFNRMKVRDKRPGKFDNRWCIFAQDMPSAAFLLRRGIKRIIVRSDKIQDDLSHILCRYQEQGLKIYKCMGNNIKAETVSKPSRFKSFIYRFSVISGLTRNSAGGFGGKVPEPINTSGGRIYGGG